MTLNEVILCGRITANPEIRYSSKPLMAFARFTLALPRRQAGNDGTEVDYPPVMCSGDLAERCERYLVKGSWVVVKGYLRTRRTVYKGMSIPTMEVVAVDVICPADRGLTYKELVYGTPDLDNAPGHMPSKEFNEDIEPAPEGFIKMPNDFNF